VGTRQLAAQVRFPTRPAHFIADEAGLINESDQQRIRAICENLLKEQGIPIMVVTLRSLSDYGARGITIEGYARSLFDTWGIGSQTRNYGILLLVSIRDRKARIELGAGWAHANDADAERIMQEIIIPNFKAGNFSAGILQGVQALDSLARGMGVKIPRPWWQPVLILGLLALGIGTSISLIRSGRKGWGWGLLAFLAAVVVGIFYAAFRGRGGSTYGGGSGGGGGATGSW
jgi:uncharacterized protein